MLRIVADEKIPFLRGVLEPYAEVKYLPGSAISRQDVLHADALIVRTRTRCDKLLLEGTTVKFIATATIGDDHIDKVFCAKSGITWVNAPGCNASSVMQYMASVLVTIQKEKKVQFEKKTLGIIGVGHVGQLVQKLAGIFGMNVLLNDPPRQRAEGDGQFTDLHQLLRQSDIITLHVPFTKEGTDKTLHLINDEALKLLKPAAWLINTSRGEIMDTRALKIALETKKIAGAVLDVWENEPEIDPELHKNVFIGTPHIAGYSADGKANGTAMAVRALSSFFSLPLTFWYPAVLPVPVNNLLLESDHFVSENDFFEQTVLHTYNVVEDSSRLRESPADFEKLRNNYPVRREFTAYSFRQGSMSEELKEKLRLLGFQPAD
jgi:erythronate-4-phosphate dehydrogenase